MQPPSRYPRCAKEPGFLVTLPRYARPNALLSIRATTLRVLAPESRCYLVFELSDDVSAALDAEPFQRAQIQPVWVLDAHLELATGQDVSVWDPSLGILTYRLSLRNVRESQSLQIGSMTAPNADDRP